MMESVPAMAPCCPPLTGASRNATPFSAHAAASSLAAIGAMVLWSTTISPGFAPASSPSAPVTTSRTSGVSGRHMTTTSVLAATSLGKATTVAPAA